MSCSIYAYAERLNAAGEWEYIPDLEPFSDTNYGVFAWFANVRNYSAIPPISDDAGLPDDVSQEIFEEYETWFDDVHSATSLCVDYLLSFDYDAVFEDRRITKQIGPNVWTDRTTCEPGEGTKTSYREFFGPEFFESLSYLRDAKADRIVVWFHN